MGIKVLSSLPSLQLQLLQKEANFLPRPQGVKKEMPADGLLRKISSGFLLPGRCLRQTAVTNKPPRPCPEPARPAPGRTKARAGPCCSVALRLPLQRSRAGERAKSPPKIPVLGETSCSLRPLLLPSLNHETSRAGRGPRGSLSPAPGPKPQQTRAPQSSPSTPTPNLVSKAEPPEPQLGACPPPARLGRSPSPSGGTRGFTGSPR